MTKYQRVFGVVIFLGLLFTVFEFSGLRANFNLAFLQQQLDHHLLGGMMIFIVLFALGNLIQIPGWIFLAAAVLTLGRGYGGLLTYVAAILSCMMTFLMIRFIGGEVLRKVDNQWVVRILSHLDEHPIRSVVLSRTLFQTAPPLNYALAISGIKFREYLLGTMLGLPLPIFIYCLFFDYLAQWMKLR